MAATLKFVGGDEVIEPFLLEDSDGEILDLTGLSVSGQVRWRGRDRLPLSIGADLTVTTLAPTRAVDPDDQVPHGFVRLTELQTVGLPYGALAKLRATVVEDDVTMTTYDQVLERVP